LAFHISAGPDFAIVSAYDPKGVQPFQIWKSPFDGSGCTLLHEWRSIYRGYESSPRGTYDDGLILFNVDDGEDVSVSGLKLETVSPAKKDEPGFIEYEPNREYPIVTQPKCPTCGSTIAGIRESKKD